MTPELNIENCFVNRTPISSEKVWDYLNRISPKLIKQRITDLLSSIDDISNVTNSDSHDSFLQRLEYLEHETTQIENLRAIESENTAIFIDILKQSGSWHPAKGSFDHNLKVNAERSMNSAKLNLDFDIENLLIPFYLEKGLHFYQRGQIDMAMHLWRKVLERDPGNKFIVSHLQKIIQDHGMGLLSKAKKDYLETAKSLSKLYLFHKGFEFFLDDQIKSCTHRGNGFLSRSSNAIYIPLNTWQVIVFYPDTRTFGHLDFNLSQDKIIIQAEFCEALGRTYLVVSSLADLDTSGNFPFAKKARLYVLTGDIHNTSSSLFGQAIQNPRGISTSTDGLISVCDLFHRSVNIYNTMGDVICTIGKSQLIDIPFFSPNRSLLKNSDSILVVDQNAAAIYNINFGDRSVQWKTTLPEKTIRGITTDLNNNLYTVAPHSRTLYKLSSRGNVIFKATLSAKMPSDVIAFNDAVYILDAMSNSISKYII